MATNLLRFMVWMMFGVIGIPIRRCWTSTPRSSAC